MPLGTARHGAAVQTKGPSDQDGPRTEQVEYMTTLRVPLPFVQPQPEPPMLPLPEAHRSILIDAQIEHLIDVTLSPRYTQDDKRVVLRALLRELIDGAVSFNNAVRDEDVRR